MLEINVLAPLEPVVVKVMVFCLLLKVAQSALLSAPLFVALAVGTLSVITGVVVPVATVELKSVPLVPIVKADTLVTVPTLHALLADKSYVVPFMVSVLDSGT